jgi:type VI protein secretion system component VasK
VIAGTVWTLYQILVITLQAIIYIIQPLINLGQSHDAHEDARYHLALSSLVSFLSQLSFIS